MKTLERNKLIAEFMGVYNYNSEWTEEANAEQYKYHTSWDWLMPVLKKINLKLTPQNYDEWRMISKPTEYTIESVHNQAVQFIKLHNENK
jgi:hypothetical protein